jgi:uncharacterized UBP type Zn finger protein
MADACTHLDDLEHDTPPVTTGCVECLAMGARWLHLRRCIECGHVGCCDQSPNRHATAHFHETAHPLIQSFEPGEDWFWCYPDELFFEVPGQGPSPSHP